MARAAKVHTFHKQLDAFLSASIRPTQNTQRKGTGRMTSHSVRGSHSAYGQIDALTGRR